MPSLPTVRAIVCGLAISAAGVARPCDPAGKAAGPPPAAPTVAVVNVVYLFDHYPALTEKKLALKADADAADAAIKAQQAKIAAQEQQLTVIAAGSAEYARLETEIARAKSEVTTEMQIKRVEFQRREAVMFLEVYNDIGREIAEYAKSHQLQLVVRVYETALNRNKPESILEYVNRPAVWYDPECDITRVIEQRIGQKAKPDAQPPATEKPEPPQRPESGTPVPSKTPAPPQNPAGLGNDLRPATIVGR